MRHWRVFIPILMVPLLAACDGGQPSTQSMATPLSRPAPSALYTVDYVHDPLAPQGYRVQVVALDSGTGSVLWHHEIANPPAIQPVELDGVVYAASYYDTQTVFHRGVLEALNPASGATLWRHETVQPLRGAPVVASGSVYVGYDAPLPPGASTDPTTGFVEEISARDGKTIWKTTVNGTPSPATVAGGAVYVATYQPQTLSGSLAALDIRTGKPLWTVAILTPLADDSGTFAPVVTNGLVYLDTVPRDARGDALVALNAFDLKDGQLVWRHPTGGLASPPVVAGGNVYLDWYTDSNASQQPAEVLALDAAAGTVRWHYALPGAPSNPTLAGGMLTLTVMSYTGAARSGVMALRDTDGTLIWNRPIEFPADADGFIPTVSGAVVGVLLGPGPSSQTDVFSLAALRTGDGSILWTKNLDGHVETPPLIFGGVIYVRAGSLEAFRESDGTLLWRHAFIE